MRRRPPGRRVPGQLTPHLVTAWVTEKIAPWPASSSSITAPAACWAQGLHPHSCASRPTTLVLHGFPSERPLRGGDIATSTVTVIVDGWHGDHSRMYAVGEIAPRARRLIEVTYEGMARGLAAIKPGNTFGDIGFAIQQYVESQRCSVVRDFCGHGVGRVFHDMPNVLHYGRPGEGAELKAGMFFTVEPMVNLQAAGECCLRLDRGDRDKSLLAQCEHRWPSRRTAWNLHRLQQGHFQYGALTVPVSGDGHGFKQPW